MMQGTGCNFHMLTFPSLAVGSYKRTDLDVDISLTMYGSLARRGATGLAANLRSSQAF